MRESDDQARQTADAVVVEIKAELGRRGMSSRALGRLIGKSSQYMSDRLDGGSSKTGKRVTLNLWDLSAIARALDLSEIDLMSRVEVTNAPRPLRVVSDAEAEAELAAMRAQRAQERG